MFEFLPERFALRQVQSLDEFEMDVAHRAAQLHRFDRERYYQMRADAAARRLSAESGAPAGMSRPTLAAILQEAMARRL